MYSSHNYKIFLIFPYYIIIENKVWYLYLLKYKEWYIIIGFSNLTQCIVLSILLVKGSERNLVVIQIEYWEIRWGSIILESNFQGLFWEKKIINYIVLKWTNGSSFRVWYFFSLSNNFINLDKFINYKNVNKLLGREMRGPHNIDIISIIVGSILGDTYLEKRIKGKGTRVIFDLCNINIEYLFWFHKFLSDRGYCRNKAPIFRKRISKKRKILFHYRINSYTFSSLNWLHDMFYTLDNLKGEYIKVIPLNLEEYLNPLALAIWFMNHGSISGSSVKIAINCFTDEELLFLCDLLKRKYNILCSKRWEGKKKNTCFLFIYKNSLPNFSKLVKPYMLPSMYYKLNGY